MPTRAYVLAWIQAFAVTEAVEAPIYRGVARVSWPAALAASALTHPFVWFFFPWLGDALEWSWTVTAIVAEAFAWAVEAAWIALVLVRRGDARPWLRGALGSLVANAASVTVGLLLRALFDWP